jgi:hypothetical protein
MLVIKKIRYKNNKESYYQGKNQMKYKN